MLGDLLFEAKGKGTGTRVLGADAQGAKVEGSWMGQFWGKGSLAGVDGNEMGTGLSVARPDGVTESTGQMVWMTKQGEGITVKAMGLGTPAGPTKMSDRGVLTFQTASPKLAWLNRAVGVYEVEYDLATQEYTAKTWQWK